MAHEVPTTEPERLVLGDTWTWKISLPDYMPADGWTLSYALVKSDAQITITASDNGDGYHLIEVAATTTAAYGAGDYLWDARVTSGSDKHAVRRGRVIVKEDYSAAGHSGGLDDRSHIQKVINAIEDVIYGRAQQDHLSYSVGGPLGRSLSRVSHAELLATHSKYKRMLAEEEQKEDIALGLGNKNRIRIRFNS